MKSHVSRSLRAFTLMELLVCVSIIVLLIALLLPALKRAKEQAQSAACKANLRSLTRCGAMYEADWGIIMPYSMNLPSGRQWDNAGIASNPSFSAPGMIMPYISGSSPYDSAHVSKILYCPVMPLEHGGVVFSQVHYGINSYGWTANSAVLKLPDIRNPAGTMEFADQGYLSSVTATYLNTGDQIYPPSLGISLISNPSLAGTFNGRHPGNKGNVAWYDGHVEELAPVIITDNPTWSALWAQWHIGFLAPGPSSVVTSQLTNSSSKTSGGRNAYFFADPDSGIVVEQPGAQGHF